MKKRNLLYQALGCAAVVFLFLVPLFRLVLMSLSQGGGYGFGNYAALFEDSRTIRAIGNTVVIALVSTLLSTALGVLFAFLNAYWNLKRKKLLELLVLAPFIIPSYVITISWTSVLTGNGELNRVLRLLHLGPVNLYSLGGIIFVLGICNIPLVYLTTVNTLRKIPRELEWAARAAGCGRWETLFRIDLAQAAPAILGGSVLAFLSCMDNFSVPAFLGIPASIPVLSTYIYEKAIGFGPDSFSLASALSVLLSVVAVSGSLAMTAFAGKARQTDSIRLDFSPRIFLNQNARRRVEWFGITFFLLLDLVPLLNMTAASFQKVYGQRFSLANLSFQSYRFLFTNSGVLNALCNSLFLSLTTCALCILIGTAAAYQKLRGKGTAVRLLEFCASLTYAIPGIVLALAMIFHWSMIPGVYGSIWILIAAYLTRYLILQIKGSTAAMLSIHPSLEEAAHVAGGGKIRMWKKILTPLLFRQTLSSSLLIFVSSLTEMTLSSILASAGTKTIGLTVFNFQQSGDYNIAYAFSVLIVILILFGYGLIQYVCRESGGKKERSPEHDAEGSHSSHKDALKKMEESIL
ncbi:ABC transporter permease [Caproicibacter fermentans]|uniref:Iron ABC transporter permease n=1 Tax=Caproicibacter fermentans TaxID=2576756 RepID=A0A7G8TEF1_9FIRM|nr:iron ABC transporter permease [Caproicibacter fermentans]QNK41992.1 iron ABC transporter permease [Caproicibacter fermentans]